MRSTAIVAALVLLSACGSGKDKTAGTPAKPVVSVFGSKPTPVATTYPQPDRTVPGIRNAEAPPEVARHIARQERCGHWREEQGGSPGTPDVVAGLARECRGIDAELKELRDRYRNDGKGYGALRQYSNVE